MGLVRISPHFSAYRTLAKLNVYERLLSSSDKFRMGSCYDILKYVGTMPEKLIDKLKSLDQGHMDDFFLDNAVNMGENYDPIHIHPFVQEDCQMQKAWLASEPQ